MLKEYWEGVYRWVCQDMTRFQSTWVGVSEVPEDTGHDNLHHKPGAR